MRTLILVVVLVAVAVMAGLSFVLPAAAQAPGSAELNVDCGEQFAGGEELVVVPAEPTLVTCMAVAGNPGPDTLTGAQLEFLPASGLPPPDFYRFWSETHDGVRSVPGPVDLIYDFGDIAPGASSTIVLEIIVRSTHGFGADVALVAQPNQREYDRRTIRGGIQTGGAPSPPARLFRDFVAQPPMTTAAYRLEVMTFGDAPYDDVSAELSPGTDVTVGPDAWKAADLPGRFLADLGPLAGRSEIRQSLSITASGACGTSAPVLVVTIVRPGVTTKTPVVDDGVLVGPCTAQLANVASLPQGGTGLDGGGGRSLEAETASVAAIGALCLGMGLSMRRRVRR